MLHPTLSTAWPEFQKNRDCLSFLTLNSSDQPLERIWSPGPGWRVPAPGCGPCAIHTPFRLICLLPAPGQAEPCESLSPTQGPLPVPQGALRWGSLGEELRALSCHLPGPGDHHLLQQEPQEGVGGDLRVPRCRGLMPLLFESPEKLGCFPVKTSSFF